MKPWPEIFVVNGLAMSVLRDEQFLHFNTSAFPVDRQLFYGVTWDEEHFYFNNALSIIQCTEDNGTKYNVYEKGTNGSHQILYKNGFIHICSTGRNCLDFFNVKEKTPQKRITFYPEAIFDDKPTKRFDDFDKDLNVNVIHSNSVFITPDNTIFVCCHNLKNPSFVCEVKNGNVRNLEIEGQECHNVYIEDNILYSLSSKETKIIKYNLETNTLEKISIDRDKFGVDPKFSYLRGLAVSKDFFIIGLAYHNHARDLRDENSGYLLRYDKSLNLIDFKKLPSDGQIRDIRLLDGDLAHNGIPAPKFIR